MALTRAAPVCSLLWLKPLFLIQPALPRSQHIVLYWKRGRHCSSDSIPLESEDRKTKKKNEAKREGTFPCPLLHGWSVIVYRRKQDHVSEQDNKAQRPARRQERADSGILTVSASVCASLSLYDMLTGHMRTCRKCNTTALFYWPRHQTHLYTQQLDCR